MENKRLFSRNMTLESKYPTKERGGGKPNLYNDGNRWNRNAIGHQSSDYRIGHLSK
jgi:hypothetical protein